ncbi:hypothetical protein AVEN_175060-1 [Araneus ventricosus]|uniref:Uncharacterized protein n=1 Tax=Araneus ventricosus TaxID=182803 RepID=A0A4Y2MN23_ARAVE|nr:hypothetical protein AVEN_175060-1 [Araneus ventricosus]
MIVLAFHPTALADALVVFRNNLFVYKSPSVEKTTKREVPLIFRDSLSGRLSAPRNKSLPGTAIHYPALRPSVTARHLKRSLALFGLQCLPDLGQRIILLLMRRVIN